VLLPPEDVRGSDGERAADVGGMDGGAPEVAVFRGLVEKLSRDTLVYFPAAILPALVSVASVAIFTRIFGAESYGRYALVAAVTSIISAVAAGWIQQGILRYLPRYQSQGRLAEFMARFAILLIAITGVWVFLMVCGSIAIGRLGAYASFYIPAACLVLGEMLVLALNTIFQSQLRSTIYTTFRITGAGLRLALSLAVVLLFRRDVVGLIVGGAAADFLLLIPLVKSLRLPPWRRIMRSFDTKFVRLLASYGLPMVGWVLGGQILGIADRFVIGAFRDTREVGIYSANYTLVTMALGLLATPILMAAHPIIMNAWERNPGRGISRIIGVLSRYYLIAIVPFVTIVGVFSRDLVALLLGEEFREGYRVIPPVLFGVAAWGLSMYGHKPLELLERTRVMLLLVAVCAIVNLALNLIFVPAFGYYASALATCASYVLYPVLVFFVTRKSIPWTIPWRTIVTTAAAASVMAAALVWGRSLLSARVSSIIMMVVVGAAGSVVYVAALAVTGELRGEFEMLRRRRSAP
jgi:O-antigen/teichoic acid export membrane protein